MSKVSFNTSVVTTTRSRGLDTFAAGAAWATAPGTSAAGAIALPADAAVGTPEAGAAGAGVAAGLLVPGKKVAL